MQRNAVIQIMQRNTIIRLVCIEGDTRFKYKRVRSKGPEQKQILEHNGRSNQSNMRLSQHMIQEHEGNRTT